MADKLWDTMLRFHHEVTLPALRAALLEERRENQIAHEETGGRFADLRRHFDITAQNLRHDIGLLAEKVIRVEEKLEQEATCIRTVMNERFDETHARIRFSHTELERRIHSLEGRQ